MKWPTTPEELRELHKTLQSDPQRYLQITNDWIRQNPENPHAYFRRHFAWMHVGEPRRAIEDLNRFIELRPVNRDFLPAAEFICTWANSGTLSRISTKERP